jgi:hypothetical protein
MHTGLQNLIGASFAVAITYLFTSIDEDEY